MKFSDICKEAESTRDRVYGLRIGSDRFGYDAVMFLHNIKGGKSITETAHAKLKREKAENAALYRAEIEAGNEISYNGHRDEMQLHKNQMAMVAGMVNGGVIDIDELDEEL